ncbi:MAG: hypothetical protein IJ087_22510, partial [Eggerthellaceae bacterium]|nr:hypothetical protein [Eggerthellaceae bacterium]
ENHSSSPASQTASGITIDGVEAPQAGKALDDTANVTTTEGATWDIPVLWVGSNMQLATTAQEDARYLPALAFYVPQGYSIAGSDFTVKLSDSLVKLFGDGDTVSVYNEATGITYIVPASLRSLFAAAAPSVTGVQGAPASAEAEKATDPNPGGQLSLIDIYCAQTARKAFTDEDLEYIIDLVLHRLEPQAVNLLLEKFPAFNAAAAKGEIGTRIGLYMYYKHGDKDGKQEHESAEEALAFVNGDAVLVDGTAKYCYMIGIDLSSLAKKKGGDPVRDSSTGKFTLLRSGEDVNTFNNTIVHEMFHAFMDDYNRTGMLGGVNLEDVITNPDGSFKSKEQMERYDRIRYPSWFTEGTASATENVFQFRTDFFDAFRAKKGESLVYNAAFDKTTLLHNYLNYKDLGGDSIYASLEYATGTDENGDKVDSDCSRYVTGYLASLYLSELASRQSSAGSAISVNNGKTDVSSAKLRSGLNSILERMHNGETLDQVVKSVSPVVNGKKLYSSTDDFEKKFIKGTNDSKGNYSGDSESLEFTVALLNSLQSNSSVYGGKRANGSILFDFDRKFDAPLDGTKEETADFYKIVDSNEYVESTVPNDVALAGGGKSESGTPTVKASALKPKASQQGADAAADRKPEGEPAEAAVASAAKGKASPAENVEKRRAAREE